MERVNIIDYRIELISFENIFAMKYVFHHHFIFIVLAQFGISEYGWNMRFLQTLGYDTAYFHILGPRHEDKNSILYVLSPFSGPINRWHVRSGLWQEQGY